MEKYYAILIKDLDPLPHLGRGMNVVYIQVDGELKEGVQIFNRGSCPAPLGGIEMIAINEIDKEFYKLNRKNIKK